MYSSDKFRGNLQSPKGLESVFSSKKFKLMPTKTSENEELMNLPLNSERIDTCSRDINSAMDHSDNIDDSKLLYSTLIPKCRILLLFYLELSSKLF